MKAHTAPVSPASLLARRDPAWARDFEAILKAYDAAGGKVDALQSDHIASAVISANRVLFVNEIPGVHIEAEETPTGIRAHIRVDPGTRVEYPVHLCFGMIPQEGVQEIIPTFEIGEGAEVGFLAHCTFPNAVNLQHIMDAVVRIGPGATMRYTEAHYHGPYGGVQVLPTSYVIVEEGGRFENEFNLTHGRVGRMEIRMEVEVGARGVAELTVKAYGMGEDYIRAEETIRLNGPEARGLTKTRVAVRDRAVGEVYTTTEGNAPGARGHMDCTEIVRGEAVARNTPIVIVRNDQARVTHEAAIGSVSRKELETLMARGLSEEEAVDIIIRGMLA
ncbi:MAG: SufD family Fe-S cluster assembly protein [Thermoflexales bacterium]|nr:SufD family Fe-S cluster assembly protein [Thermoflexales bacterium]